MDTKPSRKTFLRGLRPSGDGDDIGPLYDVWKNRGIADIVLVNRQKIIVKMKKPY
ncbi:MAG: hypothetical protein DHS20C18_44290 [Saprospiraceae bacterium]|nr:MAG: hypothetical protein DHS20C18_44290 [Saprospiraceae bacterium]